MAKEQAIFLLCLLFLIKTQIKKDDALGICSFSCLFPAVEPS